MQLNNSSTEILNDWSAAIEASLEGGYVPAIDVGFSHQPLHGVAGYLAFQRLLPERIDVAQPRVAMGGASPLWLMAQLQRPVSEAGRRHPTIVVHTGLDPGDHVAGLALLAPLSTDRQTLSFTAPPGRLLAGFVSHIQPAQSRVAAQGWDAFPLLFMTAPNAFSQTPDAQSKHTVSPTPSIGAFAAIVAALFLVLSALFF